MLSTDRRKQYAWGLIGLMSAFLAVVSVYAIQSTNKAAEVIADCTTPGGHCYQRQEREQTRTVARIKATSIASNWCTLQEALTPPADYQAIRRCVEKKLNRLEGDKVR